MRLGRYEIEGEVGRGAAGVVYRARCVESGVVVALKVLVGGLQRGRGEARFRREIEALQRLTHPNVVGVLDHGTDRGRPWVALEWIEGESLQARLSRGPLAPDEAAACMIDVARGLACAHAVGVLHRDVKPANVLLGRDGRTLLADFGLVRTLESTGDSLTQSGTMLGTPGFCAPEQAIGDRERVGIPSDVYGWGATLFAALTAQPPLLVDNLTQALVETVERVPPPPSALTPGLDPRWDAICGKALAKQPERRFATLEEAEAAVRAVLAAPPSEPSRRWPVWVGVGCLLLGGFLGRAWVRPLPATPPEAGLSVILPRLVALREARAAGRWEEAEALAAALVEEVPGCVEGWEVLGVARERRWDWEGTHAATERAIELGSTAQEVWQARAWAGWYGRGVLGEAWLADVDALAERWPDDSQTLALRALQASEAGAPVEAEALALESVRRGVGSGRGWQVLARVALTAKNLGVAEAAAREAVAIDPEDAHAWGVLGLALREQASLREAEEALRETLRCAPRTSADAWGLLALCLHDQGRVQEGIEELERLLAESPTHDGGWLMRGLWLVELGAVEAGREALRRYLELYPDRQVSAVARQTLLQGRPSQRTRQLNAALQALRRRNWERVETLATGALSGTPPPLQAAQALKVRAMARIELGDYAGAEADVEARLSAGLGGVADRAELGRLLALRGAWAQAVKELEAALRVERHAGRMLLLARAYGELRRWDQVDVLLEGFSEEERVEGYWYTRGRAKMELGQWEEAEASLDAVLARAPGHASTHYMRSVVRFRLGDLEGAEADLEGYLARAGEGSPWIDEAREVLARLREGSGD